MIINVFYTFLDAQTERAIAAWPSAYAPAAYRERVEAMRSPTARARTMAGLWLLEQALAALGEPATAITRIGLSASGRPEIAGAPAFSISHSGNLVACAVASAERRTIQVGLDVEQRRPIVPARLARLMSDAERADVERNPPRFFDYWCAREATVKASGRVGLKRICELTLEGDRAVLDSHNWPLRPLALAPDYAGCLASDQAIDEISIERLEWV